MQQTYRKLDSWLTPSGLPDTSPKTLEHYVQLVGRLRADHFANEATTQRARNIEFALDQPHSTATNVCDLFTRNRLKGRGKGGESRLK